MSSVLMVFVILCLTTFATLSLVSAGADHRLVTRSAENLRAFYEADAEAERMLLEISRALKESGGASSEAEYRALYAEKMAGLSRLVSLDGATLSFEVEAGEGKTLRVALYLPFGEDELFRKVGWQLLPSEWQSEEDSDGLKLFSSEEFDVMPMF
jgi:hypothetical protein